ERLLAGIRLRYEEIVDVDADSLRVGRIHRVLGVDEGGDAAATLRFRDHVVDERRLARRLGTEDLDDAPAWKSADAEREIEPDRLRGCRGRAGRRQNRLELFRGTVPEEGQRDVEVRPRDDSRREVPASPLHERVDDLVGQPEGAEETQPFTTLHASGMIHAD